MKLTRRKRKRIAKILTSIPLNKDTCKFAWNLAKRQFIKGKGNKALPYPTCIMLELTNKCNLHCTMCPREHRFGKALSYGNMDTALAKKVIDETYPYLQSIGLTGLGETLFAPNLVEIARYIKAKKKSIVIFISTNANIPDFIEKITPVLPFVDTVQVSIDGTGAKYDEIRVGGHFEPFEANVSALVPLAEEHGVDIMFNMVVSKDNYLEVPRVVEFAATHGIKYVNFNYLNLASIPQVSEEYYRFFDSEPFKEMRSRLTGLTKKHPEIEITGLEDFFNDFSGQCGLITNHFQVNYDGEVPPCCAKPFSKELSFGNVKDRKLIDVINSERARKFRRDWYGKTPDRFCRGCHALGHQ